MQLTRSKLFSLPVHKVVNIINRRIITTRIVESEQNRKISHEVVKSYRGSRHEHTMLLSHKVLIRAWRQVSRD